MKNKYFFLKLIDDYISCAKYMCNCITDEYTIGQQTLLNAYREKKVPKEGTLQNNIYFSFHGGGCYFEYNDGIIDVDFGPDGRSDGFERYRLYDFLQTSKLKLTQFHEFIDEKDFKIAFENLIKENVIVCPGWYPNPNLFYLKRNI